MTQEQKARLTTELKELQAVYGDNNTLIAAAMVSNRLEYINAYLRKIATCADHGKFNTREFVGFDPAD
ncbi:MAG: hypothetical protein LUI87_09445 [Lachnospiraceae bacterium]|nr:hypothetical protein [Lachnospiraceae bacterium]